jgi:CheY-like chemotaxis protein/DNA-binding CsgD family transcriptional regulator
MRSPKPYVILCVEDEVDLRADIVEELGEAGYKVLEAENGDDALKILRETKPDLILSDITMPVMGGYELIRELHDHYPGLGDVPIIFLTALADRNDIIQGRISGADDYLVKPIDYDVLLATLRSRLAQVERLRQVSTITLERERATFLEMTAQQSTQSDLMLKTMIDKASAGIVVLNEAFEIRVANSTAEEILAEADGLQRGRTKLKGVTPATTESIKRAIDSAANDVGSIQLLSLPREFRLPLLLRVSALQANDATVTAVFIVDPERRARLSPKVAAAMYGLTPTEARVASALADEKRLDEIGAELNIAPSTITFHLQNIFRKTQTSRQAELVALLVRSAALLK